MVRGRRGRGRGSLRKSGMTRAQMRHQLRGRVFSPSADPPHFSQIPWNSIVLSDEPRISAATERKSYNGKVLYALLVAQTGLKFQIDTTAFQGGKFISFRIHSVRAWNVSGGDINLQAYDLTIGFGADDYLAQIEDQPGKNRWAKVGFEWPASQQMVIISGHDEENVVQFASNLTAQRLVVHLHVLWKSRIDTLPNRSDIRRALERLSLVNDT